MTFGLNLQEDRYKAWGSFASAWLDMTELVGEMVAVEGARRGS